MPRRRIISPDAPEASQFSRPVPRVLLSVAEAGIALALSRDAVYDLIHSNQLEARKIGSDMKVSLKALEAFVETLPVVGR